MKTPIGVIALVALALACAGCPAMIVGSLAYQGYKYLHNRNEQAVRTESTKATTASHPVLNLNTQ